MSATCSPSLPNPGATPLVTYPEDNDLFYLELRYDQLFSSSSTTGGTISGLYEFPQKAGNIAQMVWRVRGRERQAYSFNYDHLSRLSFSLYYDVNTSNVASSSYRFNESYSYDNRGNIMSMYRNGYYQDGATCTFGQIDNLSYSYASNTNRLNSITDATSLAAAKARGFNPGAGGAGYTYDGNGNLKSDSYKGITNITFNHLNLPKLITFSSGNSIEVVYDAAGNKLRKIVKQGGTVQYEQDYSGGIEYRKTPASGTFRLEAIYHEEGRYFNLNVDASNTLSWQKEYAIRDHLGNTRLMFADKNGNGIIEITGNASTNEILQENHYYPFGLSYEGPAWMNDAARDNKYQYNGKEWNDDFGLNWNDYGFRFYDPAVGRWTSPDLLVDWAPDLTPFRYGFNNPILYTDPDGLFESRREARRYRRDHNDEEIRRGKIKKNEDGTFSIRYGESGEITRNAEGQIEFAAIASYTGPSIRYYEPNFFEDVQNSGFVGSFIYDLANDAWLTTQRFNPFDTHTTHLSGHYASKDEYTMGFVNTVATTVPIGRATTAIRSVTPTGVSLLQRLSSAQFSKRFKGTMLASTHPRIRGRLNRLLNKGVEQVNTRVETGNVLFYGTKMAGKADNKEE